MTKTYLRNFSPCATIAADPRRPVSCAYHPRVSLSTSHTQLGIRQACKLRADICSYIYARYNIRHLYGYPGSYGFYIATCVFPVSCALSAHTFISLIMRISRGYHAYTRSSPADIGHAFISPEPRISRY